MIAGLRNAAAIKWNKAANATVPPNTAGQNSRSANRPGSPAARQRAKNPSRFSPRHHGSAATYFARYTAGLGSGRVNSQINVRLSRSFPIASVAKLSVQSGSRKLWKIANTTQREKTRNAE